MDFSNLGIFDLRNYARMVGVRSPTSKKRQILIEEINQVLEGKLEKTKTNRGRKTKQIALKIYDNLPIIENKKQIDLIIKRITSLRYEINIKLKELERLLTK